MKILVTGCNAPQVGSKRLPLSYATGCRALVSTLQSLGHEVDWRPVVPGEPLAHDRVVCYVTPPHALTAQYTYGMLWALSRRPDAVVALDDWQTREIVSGYRTFANDLSRFWKTQSLSGNPITRRFRAEALGVKDALEQQVCDKAARGFADHELWAPVFPGGDVASLGVPARSYWGFDPSPWCHDQYPEVWGQEPPHPEVRLRSWVCASLLDKSKWVKDLGVTWGLLELGNKKQEQVRVPEVEVVKHYRSNWGVLCPPHYHALRGSRWWRARYVFAARARCVLLGDQDEVAFLGSTYHLRPGDVETLAADAVDELARAQEVAFWNRCWKLGELHDKLEAKVREGRS
jgi:hypothetical protein